MKYFIRFSRVMIVLMLGILLAISSTPSPTFAKNFSHSSAQATGSPCLQPPQNVDLMTLSDAALASYGLPSHAILDTDSAHWSGVLAHAKQHTCGSGNMFIKRRTSFPRVASSSVNHSTNSTLWGDYEATGARGKYKAATLTFNVPFLASTNPSNAVDSVWVGVGGDENYAGAGYAVLPQVGVDSTASGSDNCGDHQYNESWWELADKSDPGATNLPLSRVCAGDRIYVWVSSNMGNNGDNYYYIDNLTANSYNSYTSHSQVFSDSATSECVQERLGGGTGNPVAQPNPNGGSARNTIEIDSCYSYDFNDNGNGIGNWPHISYQIVNSSNVPLVTPQPLFNSGQNFLFLWKQSH